MERSELKYKYHYTQRIPNFIDTDRTNLPSGFFNTVEDLKDVEFIERWIKKPDFDHLENDGGAILAYMKDGSYWGIAIVRTMAEYIMDKYFSLHRITGDSWVFDGYEEEANKLIKYLQESLKHGR